MVDAVLLEWEGVLADTGAARRDSLQRALADEGVLLDAAAYDACCEALGVHGATSAALADVGRHDPTLAELVALRAGGAFAERLSQGFSLQPGAVEFIMGAEHRARIVIVTTAARAETELALRLSGLESSVAHVIAADDALAAPPAPEMYERALAKLARRRAVSPARVVALVRASAAVRAARQAGVRTLTVGAPAHVAMDADAAVAGLSGLTLDDVATLLGMRPHMTPE